MSLAMPRLTLVDRYVVLHFCKSAAVVLALLLALFGFMTLTEELDDVGVGSFTTIDGIAVVILTTPTRIIELLPVTTLLGSVLGLGTLANHGELLALRAAGLSPWRIARGLLVATAVLIVLAMAARATVVPMVERQAQEYRSKTLPQTAIGGAEFWSRSDNRFLRVGGVDFGRIPREIEIYELGVRGRLQRLLQADKADIVDARTWLLHDVDERVLGDDSVAHRRMATLEWQSFLTPEQLATLIAPAHALSVFDLYAYIREMRGSGVDTREYQAMFWQQLALPGALLAMTLLGLPFVLAGTRSRTPGTRVVAGGVAGVGFYLFNQITSHLATLLDLPPAPTALAPSALLLLVAVLAIRRAS